MAKHLASLAKWWQCMTIACLLMIACSGAALAQEASEAQVKAAFLYKFTGYVEWPPAAFQSADAPLVIAIVADDEVLQALTRMVSGRRAGNRQLVVRRLDIDEANGIQPGSLNGVHLLFVGSAAGARLGKLMALARGRPILTVADTEGALQAGFIVNFLVVDQQMRFQVLLPAATQNSLKISSRLLSVAHQVITEP